MDYVMNHMKGDSMRHNYIITHALLAKGLKSAVELIMGEQEQLISYCAYVDPDQDACAQLMQEVENIVQSDDVLVITDILGGSVNTAVMPLLSKPNVHIITGANLLLMMQLLMLPDDCDLKLAIPEAIEQAKQGIVYVNAVSQDEEEEDL